MIGKQFLEIINTHFDNWLLSPSEKEVALLLLRGLSLEDISNIRNTKEKTIRQQAYSIYKKSDLSGRHKFAAWFLEELLDSISRVK